MSYAKAIPRATRDPWATEHRDLCPLRKPHVTCRQCGAVVEQDRECYATPVCYECRPPPKPLVRTCTCLGTCKGADGLAAGWRCAIEPKEQR